jgi:hypothetical protein
MITKEKLNTYPPLFNENPAKDGRVFIFLLAGTLYLYGLQRFEQ